jgi:hypothetical protein
MTASRFNYSTIKEIAIDKGVSVDDLVVMHKSNDPFYVGCPADIRDAEWFAKVWAEYGIANEHLRAFHYWLVSDKRPKPFELPRTVNWTAKDNKPAGSTDIYINHKACWIYMQRASMKARDLGLVDPDEIADNRSPKPDINASFYDEDNISYDILDHSTDIPHLQELPLLVDLMPGISIDIEIDQPYLVEIWIEKSTLDKILVPLCQRYNANLIVGQGFATATAVRNLLKRAQDSGKPTRVLYISDYDPKGRKMPPAVARRIEFYQRNGDFNGLDIALDPIVLTAEQIDKYDLPRSPDDDQSVELDAMKANYPAELEAIIEEAILRYYDLDLERKKIQALASLNEQLKSIRAEIGEEYKSEIEDLDAEYKTISDEINGVLGRHQERFNNLRDRFRQLSDSILKDTEEKTEQDVDIFAYVPDPEVEGDRGQLLYHSGRDYLTQLEIYKSKDHE